MRSREDCLRILGLPPGATSDEIRQAYRDLVKVWHPDRFIGDDRLSQKATEKLKEINEAYDRLQSLIPDSSRDPSPSKDGSPKGPYGSPSTKPEENSEQKSEQAMQIWWEPLFWGIIGTLVTLWIVDLQSGRHYRSAVDNGSGVETAQDQVDSKSRITKSESSDSTYPTDSQPREEPQEVIQERSQINVALNDTLDREQHDGFSLGSPKMDVIRLQGTPTDIGRYDILGHEVWHYGSSTVQISIRSGRVEQWNNKGNLRVLMRPGRKATGVSSFTLGSHRDDVIRLQGTPIEIDRYETLGHEVWYYGSSTVQISIRTGQVEQWHNEGNLRVRLQGD